MSLQNSLFYHSKNQQTVHHLESHSPQSQSGYSPQNSPHLIPSPTTSYSANQQFHFTLSNQFDQITLVQKEIK